MVEGLLVKVTPVSMTAEGLEGESPADEELRQVKI